MVDGGCALWELEFNICQKSQPFQTDVLLGRGYNYLKKSPSNLDGELIASFHGKSGTSLGSAGQYDGLPGGSIRVSCTRL